MSISSTEEILRLYFRGELDNIIERFHRKLNKEFSDNYYITIGSIDHTKVFAGNTNRWTDPTGTRAVKLADLRTTIKNYYENYKLLKLIIDKTLLIFSAKEIYLLKTYLGLTKDTVTKLSKKYSNSKYVLNKTIKNILEKIDKKINGGMKGGSKGIIREY